MGRDIMGSAQTGTGKTASFTLPLIDILASGRSKARMPRSLILAPTRELAAQVAESFEKFATNHDLSMALLIGGVSFSDQESALDKGVDVLIATPGRLIDHFERGKVLLQDVKILVIDEADRMLDMGFIPDVERIVSFLPKIRQTLFFSATLSDEIHKIGSQFVMNPRIIEVARPSETASTIEQRLVWTEVKQKRSVLRQLLTDEDINNGVIFCNRKRDIATLLTSLKRHGFSACALHGDMTQSARLVALQDFKDGKSQLLIASDVAARGLDIPTVSHVFNFDVPSNAEDYVHRIGRTGRAGRTGKAFTLAASEDDKKYISAIESLTGKPIPTDENGSTDASKPSKKSAQKSAEKSSGKPSGRKPSKTSAQKSDDGVDNQSDNQTESQNQNQPRTDASASPNDKQPRRSNRNRRHDDIEGEKRPPAWTGGNSFKDADSIPDFLKSA